MMKKIFLFSLLLISTCYAQEGDLRNNITETVQELIPQVETRNEFDYVLIAREVQFWIFVFVGVIAVAFIIYIGAKLIWSPGNMEELSSAMKSLVFIVIGLALIPFSYFLVQLIVNIRIG